MPKLSTRELMHGAALIQLLPERAPMAIENAEGGYVSGYVLNDGKVGVYLKLTTQPGGRAQFTFTPENVAEMMDVQRQCDRFYLGLVSAADGVCALTWDEFASLIAVGERKQKTLALRKMHRTRFRVTGSDSQKELVIPATRWNPYILTSEPE